MTIEEYLTNVKRIYYQMSVIVKGKQILATGNTARMTDIRDSKSKLNTIRFATRFSTLSLPAATEVEPGINCAKYGNHVIIDYGGVHLVVWPIKEDSNA